MKTTMMLLVSVLALAIAGCNCNTETIRTDETTTNTNTQSEVDNTDDRSADDDKGSRYDTVYLEPERVGEGNDVRKDTLNDEDGTTGGIDSTHRRSGGKGTPYP